MDPRGTLGQALAAGATAGVQLAKENGDSGEDTDSSSDEDEEEDVETGMEDSSTDDDEEENELESSEESAEKEDVEAGMEESSTDGDEEENELESSEESAKKDDVKKMTEDSKNTDKDEAIDPDNSEKSAEKVNASKGDSLNQGNNGLVHRQEIANVALTRARKYPWILGHETTLLRSNSVWSKVVKDAKKRFCYFRADEDQYLATAIDHFKSTETNLHMGQDLKAMETSSDTGQGKGTETNLDKGQSQLSCPSPPRCSKSSIYTQLTGASLIEATIEEEDSMVDATIEEANIVPGKGTETNLNMGPDLKAMESNSDTGQGQLSCPSPPRCSKSSIYTQLTGASLIEAALEEEDGLVDATIEEANIEPVSSLSQPQCNQFAVGAVIEEANNDFSPSHVPSRKRLRKSADARSEVPEAEPEVAQAVEAAVEDDGVTIDVLPPLAEGSNTTKAYTSMKKRAKRENLYEEARSATDNRFWSIKQQEMYDNVYKTRGFADNRWIDWEYMKRFKEMLDVETKCKKIGLHKLMGIRKEWHEETVRQFFSTLYINPSRTSLTWMSGTNMKITVTKRFCEKVLLVDPLHSSKIEGKLTSKDEEVFNTWKKNDAIFSVANRLLRKTIYPKAGDISKVHNDNKVILYHLLTEKPFDIVDIMFTEMEKAQREKRRLIPYAPYIMLLIDSATKGKFVPKTKEFRAHNVYQIMQIETINTQMETEQHQNKKAVSKDKASLSVPPLNPKSKTLVSLNPNW